MMERNYLICALTGWFSAKQPLRLDLSLQ